MQQRVSFITLAVRDVEASRAFYVESLGWEPAFYAPGEVLMIRVGARVVLSLWDAAQFEAEVGPIARGRGVPPITLAHNVAEAEQVDAVLALAASIGADPVQAAQHREWGGYSGYFADPDGYRWEVAVNPSELGESLLP